MNNIFVYVFGAAGMLAIVLRIAAMILPEKKKVSIQSFAHAHELDRALFSQPEKALQAAVKEISRSSERLQGLLYMTGTAVRLEKKEDLSVLLSIQAAEQKRNSEITKYLSDLTLFGKLTVEQVSYAAGLLDLLYENDSLCTLCAEVAVGVQTMLENEGEYSAETMCGLRRALPLIAELYADIIDIIENNDEDSRIEIQKLKSRLLDMDQEIQKAQNGMLYSIGRMQDSCRNLAEIAVGAA
ncbi:MAG: hypothetical protein LIO94_08810 [Clostridiales bacterium]|nr:hypothetical protein [Clostridiales bacterium]